MREELHESFVALTTAELPRLRRFAYGVCGDWHRADDLVQAALERMYVRWPRIHDVVDPGAYARTVLARLAINQTRRSWWRRERATDVVPDTAGDDLSAAAVDRLDVAEALAGLSAKQRAVVILRYLEDRPVEEVAEILGVAAGTVKRQSSDALARLRHRLRVDDEAWSPGREPDGIEGT